MIKLKTGFNESFQIPKKNIICYLLCLGVIVAFFGVYIWPGIKELEKINLQIELLKLSIKRQEKLFPFYEILAEENNRLNKYDILNSFEIEKCDSQRIMFEIDRKCQENQINLTGFKPILKKLEGNSEQLSFSIEMQGNLKNLNRFLKQVVMLSCVEHIEKIDIKKNDIKPSLLTHKISLLLNVTGSEPIQIKGD